MYTVKKVLIQSKKQLDLVRDKIRVSSLFKHEKLLSLLDHAIIVVKGPQGSWNYKAYLMFPIHFGWMLFDNVNVMQSKKNFTPLSPFFTFFTRQSYKDSLDYKCSIVRFFKRLLKNCQDYMN